MAACALVGVHDASWGVAACALVGGDGASIVQLINKKLINCKNRVWHGITVEYFKV